MNKEMKYNQRMFVNDPLLKEFQEQQRLEKKYPNWVNECLLRESNRQKLLQKWSINAARCYSNVFRDEPWKEAFRNKEGEFIGLDEVNEIKTWSKQGLTRAYPLKDTQNYILGEISKANSVVVYRQDEKSTDRLTAFGWGYAFENIEDLVESKWSDATQIEKTFVATSVRSRTEGLQPWYLSEVGVLAKNRERGTATALVTELVNNAPAGLPIVMRTNANSPMTIIAEKLGFDQVLGPITQRINNQIVVSQSEYTYGLDPLNSDRVLYVRQPKERSFS